MTAKKRKNCAAWRPAVEHETGRRLIPTNYGNATHLNAHVDDDVSQMDYVGVTDVATRRAEAWAGGLQAALEDTLPGYRERDAGQVGAFTETQDALAHFLGDLRTHQERLTATEAMDSLERLAAAAVALAKAWDKADIRAREVVFVELGAGLDGGPLPAQRMERARARVQRDDIVERDDEEGADEEQPDPDAFSAGVRRMIAFRETARAIEKAARAKISRDPRAALYDGLIEQLGLTYTAHTGKPVDYSTKRNSARRFFEAVTALSSPPYVPSKAMIAGAVRRIMRKRRTA